MKVSLLWALFSVHKHQRYYSFQHSFKDACSHKPDICNIQRKCRWTTEKLRMKREHIKNIPQLKEESWCLKILSGLSQLLILNMSYPFICWLLLVRMTDRTWFIRSHLKEHCSAPRGNRVWMTKPGSHRGWSSMEPACRTWPAVPKYLLKSLRMTVLHGLRTSFSIYLDKFGCSLQFHQFVVLENHSNTKPLGSSNAENHAGCYLITKLYVC